jgi:hypothetical protein
MRIRRRGNKSSAVASGASVSEAFDSNAGKSSALESGPRDLDALGFACIVSALTLVSKISGAFGAGAIRNALVSGAGESTGPKSGARVSVTKLRDALDSGAVLSTAGDSGAVDSPK